MKNSVKTRFWVIIGSLIFLSFSFGLIFSENSYAKVKSEEDLWKLALFQGVPVCYSGYANDSIDKGSFTTIDTDRIFNQSKKISGSTFGKEDASTVFLPTYVYSFASDTNLEKWSTDNGQRDKDSDFSCKQVFNGWDTNLKGLKDLYTLPTTFEGWGYETGDAKITAELSVDNTTGYRLNNKKMELSLIGKGNGAGIDSCSVNVEIVKVDAENTDKGTYVIRCISNQMVVGRKDVVSAYAGGNLEETGGGLAIAGEYEDVSGFIAVIDLSGTTCVVKGLNDGCLGFNSIDLPAVQATLELLSVGYVTGGTNQPTLGRRSIPEQGNGRRESDQRTTLERVFGENAPNLSFSATGSVDSNSYTPIGGSKTSAAKRMLYLMDNVKSLPALKRDEKQEITYQWTNSYIYSLYHYYLQDAMAYYNGKKAGNILIGGGEDGCGSSVADGWTYVFRNAKEEGEDGVHTFCKVEIQSDILSEVEGLHVSAVDMREQNGTMKRGTFKEVLDWFKSDAAGTLEKDEYTNLKVNDNGYLVGTAEVEQPTTTDQGENASGTTAATCQSSGGAGAVGWIVCPILEWMGNSATSLYTDYVEPRLKINPKLFQTLESGNENPTQNAWGTFQTIANVVFIILLLVVIFSQLTGIGIDNYGIKRILPKLIVVAILVNLSYLICVICVDLSNILGGSLKGLFDSLGASLGDIEVNTGVASTSALGNDSWIPVVLFGILVTFIIVGAASIVFNPAILLTLLISGLGVVISVLFIFVLFAVREAAIVVLTVVAPIAFVCYALPNTKKLFDKWLKAWEGLLLVYPICGLLIGGGDYISRLLITVEGAGTNETGFFPLMTAMVVGIAPIFFIPTLLKGSFAAMGNIGAKVSGIGKTLSGRATKAATNSGINKRAQEAGARHRDSLRSGYRMNKDGEMVERRGLNSLGRKFARTKVGRAIGADRRAGEAMSRYASSAEARYKDKWAATAAGGAVMMANSMTRRSSEKEKMYSDNFARETDRGVIEKAFVDSLKGGDKELASTSMRSLIERGGVTEVFNALKGADWDNMDSNVKNTLVQAMGSTNVDALRSFSKYRSTGGSASFSEWTTGKLSDEHARLDKETNERAARENRGGIKDGTYSSHLQEIGQNALSSYSKDEMQLVQRNADSLRESMGKDTFGTMVMNSAINNNDSKSQNVANDIIKSEIKNSHLEATNMGLTADKISRMADNTAEALQGGYVERGDGMSEADARGVLSTQLANEIQGVNNEERLRNQTSNGVKAVFGIGGGGTNSVDSGGPGAPGTPDAPGGGSEELNRYNQFLESREGENQQARERRGAGEEIFTVPREEPYDGETNTNSETGNARTRSVFDLYPRQAGESQADYTQRLRNMSQMRSRAEANPPEPQIRFNDTYRTRRAEPARGSAIPSDLNERRRLFPRREGETTASYGARLKSDNPWGNS